MPVSKQPGESKKDFISRCIAKEISSGKESDVAASICYNYWDELSSATQSVTDNTWSTEAPISIDLESYTDYPEGATSNAKRALDWAEKNGWGSCGEATGKQRANQLANGEPISRDTIARMASFKRHQQHKDVPYSEGCGGLMYDAWGGDAGINWAQRKLAQIDAEKLSLGAQRRVIFNEDFNEEVVRDYRARGFKVHIRSSRKIKKQDKKVWNKLKSVGLTEDHLVFGEVKELNKRWQYDEFCTGHDPILEYLKAQEPVAFKLKKVIKTIPINSKEDIQLAIQESKNVDIKFATIKVLFVYSKRDDVTGDELLPTSREFCIDVIATQGQMQGYTSEQIQNLPTEHLIKMGLPPDPFTYRGGFYTSKGGERGPDTTPFCRHQWKAKVVMV